MTKRHLVIATRESPLAICQAEIVRSMLLQAHPGLAVEFLGITTEADRRLDKQVIEFGGKGAFVKELEEALFDGRADIAVHSMKDVPMDLPPGLSLPIILSREDVRDAFVSDQYISIMSLPMNARVGTSSLRRQTQLLAMRPDIEPVSIRGNLQTRLRKMKEENLHGLILASAGLKRMSMHSHIKSFIEPEDCLPAAGQGALGVECRANDDATLTLLECVNDGSTQICVTAERAMCRRLGGGCHVPIAAYAKIEQDRLLLRGLVAGRRGKKILRSERLGSMMSPEDLGLAVAAHLIEQGAEDILKEYGV